MVRLLRDDGRNPRRTADQSVLRVERLCLGSVIFVFMRALATGYQLGGLYSRHNARVTRLCITLAAAALTTSPILFAGEPMLNWVFDHFADPRLGLLISCFGLYFVP